MATTTLLTFQRLVTDAQSRGASDVHLSPGSLVMFRIDGKLVTVGDHVVEPSLVEEILAELFSEHDRNQLVHDGGLVRAIELAGGQRVKVSVRRERNVLSLTCRVIVHEVPTLAALGFPASVIRMSEARHGVVLIAGPFDSGKTNTLAAFLDAINNRERRYIVTFEQPVELVIPPRESIIEQREIPRDVANITQGLQSVREEDVDVIAVTGLTTSESVAVFFDLVRTGRLVVVTLEVASIVQVFAQLQSLTLAAGREAARQLLSEGLVGAIFQRLVPRAGGGRKLVLDYLIPTAATRAAIREDRLATLPNIIATSRGEGMLSLDRMLIEAVSSGEVRLADALLVANDPEAVKSSLRR